MFVIVINDMAIACDERDACEAWRASDPFSRAWSATIKDSQRRLGSSRLITRANIHVGNRTILSLSPKTLVDVDTGETFDLSPESYDGLMATTDGWVADKGDGEYTILSPTGEKRGTFDGKFGDERFGPTPSQEYPSDEQYRGYLENSGLSWAELRMSMPRDNTPGDTCPIGITIGNSTMNGLFRPVDSANCSRYPDAFAVSGDEKVVMAVSDVPLSSQSGIILGAWSLADQRDIDFPGLDTKTSLLHLAGPSLIIASDRTSGRIRAYGGPPQPPPSRARDKRPTTAEAHASLRIHRRKQSAMQTAVHAAHRETAAGMGSISSRTPASRDCRLAISRHVAMSGRNRTAVVQLSSTFPGDTRVVHRMRPVVGSSALRTAIVRAIAAAAMNSHHMRSPASRRQGGGEKKAREPSNCPATAADTTAASVTSTSTATRTIMSFAAAAAPRRGWTSIVVVTCRDDPLRGSRVYSPATTLAASTTTPATPMATLAIPTSGRTAIASGSPAADLTCMSRSMRYSTSAGITSASAAPQPRTRQTRRLERLRPE